MTLARRLREARERAGLSLERLADDAGVSKTYLWELEQDERGEKKPSADVLLRIAKALDTTIADLLGLPSVRADERTAEVSPSLVQFRALMKKLGTPLRGDEFRDLAAMQFRGGQPRTKEAWYDLYQALKRSTGR